MNGYFAIFTNTPRPPTPRTSRIVDEIIVAEALLHAEAMTAALLASDFADLTAPHMPRLFRLGLRLTRQPTESADLVQEALCRAWANWSRFERSGNLGAYLSRILYNAFVSKHRHARVVASAAERYDLTSHLFDSRRLDHAADPQESWDDGALSDEVVEALATLPPHYADVVRLVDIRGLAYRDAADQLGVPLGTVMSRLHRARRMMRTRLAEYARRYGYGRVTAAA
jgi:RNA polymerase sigma-70 factor, ECF subfamily